MNQATPVVDYVARMRALMPLIEAESDASNKALKLTQPVIDAFAEGGFFKLMAPKEAGGGEADPDTIIDVLADCTYADGSAGWNLVVNTSSLSTSAYIDPARAREILSLKNGASGGAINPWRGVAHEEKGGFRVAGQYALGSATSHATHITSGGMLHRNGELVMTNGRPGIRVFFLPKANVVHDDDWDVLGLSGSGSFDYQVPEQFVEEGWTWDLLNPVVRSGGKLFLLGTYGVAAIGFVGFALGNGRRALDEIEKLVIEGDRKRAGQMVLMRDQQVFQREFGKLNMALRAAELLARESYHKAFAHFDRGNPLDAMVQEDIRVTSTYITQVAEECVTFAFKVAGSKGFRNPSKIQRVYRDMVTGARHVSVDETSYDNWTKLKLGLPLM